MNCSTSDVLSQADNGYRLEHLVNILNARYKKYQKRLLTPRPPSAFQSPATLSMAGPTAIHSFSPSETPSGATTENAVVATNTGVFIPANPSASTGGGGSSGISHYGSVTYNNSSTNYHAHNTASLAILDGNASLVSEVRRLDSPLAASIAMKHKSLTYWEERELYVAAEDLCCCLNGGVNYRLLCLHYRQALELLVSMLKEDMKLVHSVEVLPAGTSATMAIELRALVEESRRLLAENGVEIPELLMRAPFLAEESHAAFIDDDGRRIGVSSEDRRARRSGEGRGCGGAPPSQTSPTDARAIPSPQQQQQQQQQLGCSTRPTLRYTPLVNADLISECPSEVAGPTSGTYVGSHYTTTAHHNAVINNSRLFSATTFNESGTDAPQVTPMIMVMPSGSSILRNHVPTASAAAPAACGGGDGSNVGGEGVCGGTSILTPPTYVSTGGGSKIGNISTTVLPPSSAAGGAPSHPHGRSPPPSAPALHQAFCSSASQYQSAGGMMGMTQVMNALVRDSRGSSGCYAGGRKANNNNQNNATSAEAPAVVGAAEGGLQLKGEGQEEDMSAAASQECANLNAVGAEDFSTAHLTERERVRQLGDLYGAGYHLNGMQMLLDVLRLVFCREYDQGETLQAKDVFRSFKTDVLAKVMPALENYTAFNTTTSDKAPLRSDYLMECLSNRIKPHHDVLDMLDSITADRDAQTLLLGHLKLGDGGSRVVLSLLPRLHRLRYLDLSGNNLHDETMLYLALAVRYHPALERINLSQNLFTDACGGDLLRIARTVPKLTELILQGCPMLPSTREMLAAELANPGTHAVYTPKKKQYGQTMHSTISTERAKSLPPTVVADVKALMHVLPLQRRSSAPPVSEVTGGLVGATSVAQGMVESPHTTSNSQRGSGSVSGSGGVRLPRLMAKRREEEQ